jgi:hypothetical protein
VYRDGRHLFAAFTATMMPAFTAADRFGQAAITSANPASTPSSSPPPQPIELGNCLGLVAGVGRGRFRDASDTGGDTFFEAFSTTLCCISVCADVGTDCKSIMRDGGYAGRRGRL